MPSTEPPGSESVHERQLFWTKIGACIGAVGIVVAILAWLLPFGGGSPPAPGPTGGAPAPPAPVQFDTRLTTTGTPLGVDLGHPTVGTGANALYRPGDLLAIQGAFEGVGEWTGPGPPRTPDDCRRAVSAKPINNPGAIPVRVGTTVCVVSTLAPSYVEALEITRPPTRTSLPVHVELWQ